MAIKNKYKFIRFIVIVGVFFYILYKIIISVFVDINTSYVAKYDQMYLEKTYKGLIIRNEKIFSSDIPGEITYLINDGEAVKKGQAVAKMKVSSSGSQKDAKSLKNDRDTEEMIKEEVENVNMEIDLIKDNIVIAVKDKNYFAINKLKERLRLKLDLKNKLKNNSVKNFNMEELSNRNSVKSNNMQFYSNYSGIISKSFDGLEKTLTMANIYLIDYSKLYNNEINIETKKSGLIKANEKVYRIIDNYSYYIAYMVPFEDIRLYKNNIKELKTIINGEEYIASVYDCFEYNSNGILLLEFNETINDFYKKRKVESKIISDKFKGIKVYNDSLVSVNGVEGVYRGSLNNKPEFIPVKVLSKSEKYAIIEKDYFYIYENDKRKKVNSININDEIYRKGFMYKDNKGL